MDSADWYTASTPCGFPHSDIPGSTLPYSSPRHFVVRHVLLRLLAPRHPPCALCNFSCRSPSFVIPFRSFCPPLRVSTNLGQSRKSLHDERGSLRVLGCSFRYPVFKEQFLRSWWTQAGSN